MYAFVIIILILLYIIDKIKRNRIDRIVQEEVLEKIEKIKLERESRLKAQEEKLKEKEYVVRKILDDRICKYENCISIVINSNELIQLKWSEDGKVLNHYSNSLFDYNFNYRHIVLLENIVNMKDKEIINDVKSLLINLYDVIAPDIEKFEQKFNETRRSLNIVKNIKNSNQYIDVLKKYLSVVEELLHKATELKVKYIEFISELIAGYELDKIEKDIDISLIDRNIDYKSLDEHLKNQYEEYSSFKKIYEELSKEMKETL